MFSKSAAKRPRTVSISSDDIEIISPPVDPQFPPSKRAKTHDPSPDTSASVPSSSALDPAHGEAEFTAESELLEDLEVPPEQLEKDPRSREGDVAVDSIVAADDIADWVDTVLDDAASKEPAELEALAVASLNTARKEQNYRNTVLFAALADFYRWLPRMERLRAALRVAKNHGRGPAFRRVLCAQARFFEANGALKPGYQGRREKHNGLLDNKGFYMGVQRWLRTLDVGTVNPTLLQRHVNSTLLPSLSVKKTTVSIRHCQRWLWKLGYRRKRHHIGEFL
ncbi:hypothetical protein B0H10DRAFT_2214741 [Mycena sp. CBHHK59/15]|nr:hypothetical protein B0H10DRAFT_2214741 [Mycena sp. CBHHK59/15]